VFGAPMDASAFLGIVLSVTAISVVAALLIERGQTRREFAQVMLAAGITTELCAWVFVAVAAGESHLLLPDGAYFSLHKPELQALRALIDEARLLQDAPGGRLRISRFQAGLWEELAALRGEVARLLGAEPGEVALAPSITAALSAAASCFECRARPKIVVADIDFPTLAYQWLAKVPGGVEVAFARSPDGLTVPLEEFERLIDERTMADIVAYVRLTQHPDDHGGLGVGHRGVDLKQGIDASELKHISDAVSEPN